MDAHNTTRADISDRIRGYYFITDKSLSRAGIFADTEAAAGAGTRIVQYREKNASTAIMIEEASALKAICALHGALFIVNDRIDVALAAKADGVHLGQDDMPCSIARKLLGPAKIIGISVQSAQGALRALSCGANYIAVSPVFSTATKTDAGKGLGLQALKDIRRAVSVPVAAIGGINLENASSVIAAGADAVCAISDVLSGADTAERIRSYQRLFISCQPAR